MTEQRFTLLRGGVLFDPMPIDGADVLYFGDRIVAIGNDLTLPIGLPGETVDLEGRRVSPGLIDLHVHLLGGGGEAGPACRVPEIQLSSLIRAGVTTVVGVLGTDAVTRSPQALLAKTKALRSEGISAFMYTGAYELPSPTITGNVRSDLALIEEIIGVKVALSDHRSPQPSFDELCRLAAEARVGGMLGNKPGIVHVHVGSGGRRLAPIRRVLEETEIPITQFLPTHVARTPELLSDALQFAAHGGAVDVTVSGKTPEGLARLAKTLHTARDSGAPWKAITLSSDSNGSMPRFDDAGKLVGMAAGDIASMPAAVAHLASAGFTFSEVLALVTHHPALRLGLADRKGRLAVGHDADLVVWDEQLRIERVIARGRTMVSDGIARAKGTFE